jgi:crotonobetainyl-CoA:carnitine CoA-transferase CaiB-like acyl-CoA transferase
VKRFEDLIVVELAGSLAGGYCAKLFADHGASVTHIGASTLPAAQVAYLTVGNPATGSHTVGHRTTDVPGELLDTADVVIESSASGRLAPLEIRRDEIVHVQLSPFGSTGPYAAWRGSDLVDYALGGHLYLYGDPEREPLRGPPNQPRYAAGLLGFIGAMAALFGRQQTGVGQVVEVSHVEAMAALHQFTLLRNTLGHDVLRRMGNRFSGQGQPNSIYPCADGWVCVSAPTADQVERLLDITELAHLLDHDEITSPMDFQVHPDVLDDALEPWLAERSCGEIVDLLQAVRVPASPVASMGDLLADEHLAERDYWRDGHLPPVDGATGRPPTSTPLRVPGPPFRMSGHPWRGEPVTDNVANGRGVAGAWDPPAATVAQLAMDGPLAGTNVLDLTRVWAGPLATRILASLGADVVWVEAPWGRGPRHVPDSVVQSIRYYPDNDPGDRPWNRSGHIVKFGLGKRSLVLDLAKPEGIATFERLVPWADVVIENFSSRVMPQFGLDETRIGELNPGAVYVTMPGYGRSGPAEHWLAFGTSIDSHAGLSSLVGYADARPWKGGVAWPDPIAGLHATCATLIALWDRAIDPYERGQTVEVPQFEATVATVGDQLVAAQLGERPTGSSNRSSAASPEGVYPCRGDDRWIAITVSGEQSWAALCDVAGFDADMLRLGPGERADRHDELDRRIAAWTSDHDQLALAAELQERGVAAAPVHDSSGVLNDPHFAERKLFATIEQPEVGPFTTPEIPIRLSLTPPRTRRSAPLLGEHNADVLTSAGDFTTDEIDALADADVIADEPPD